MSNSHQSISAATEHPRGMEPILNSLMQATLDYTTTDRPTLRKRFEEIIRGQLRDPAQAEQVRAAAIEECAALMRRWRDEAAEFKDERCRQQANLCQNASVAISNLAKTAAQPPAAPVETKGDRYVHVDNVVYHLDDIEVGEDGKCAWTDVANALTHIRLCVEPHPRLSAGSDYVTVPVVPTEAMWGGLARDIIMWTRFDRPSQRSLLKHLASVGTQIPDWLAAECRDIDHVPPKGSVAAWVYRAMLDARPLNEPQPVSVWQPVETAPKDGTPVDLFSVSGRRWCDYRFDKEQRYPAWTLSSTKDFDWQDRPIIPASSVTHWMPLPSSPLTRPERGTE
jgi:hypothetical protein